ncbi:MAG: DUF368 domain-containing protein [Propionibacterium sp.]|nr:DUF368 domain-containing protein [Propionibacterium sp.]
MTASNDTDLTHRPRHVSAGDVVFDLFRGGLIGVAELIPGVSGGTIALIVGVYERMLDSGNHLISAVKRGITGPDRRAGFGAEIRKVDWWLLVPMLIGMGLAVVTLAGTMATFVTDHAELSRGLFLGMVGASVAVPLLLVDWSTVRGRPALYYGLLFVVGAVLSFLATSQGAGVIIEDPPMPLVFVAAAFAICALALPGVSGSFFLLLIGLYAPTMQALDEANLTYIAVFAAGAITGLAAFIKVLHWLLRRFHRIMMFGMAGLMLGSLRALWPWQGPAGEALAPSGNVGGVVALMVGGAVLVAALVAIDRFLTRRNAVFDASERLNPEVS